MRLLYRLIGIAAVVAVMGTTTSPMVKAFAAGAGQNSDVLANPIQNQVKSPRGVARFAQVTSTLYRGGQPTMRGFEDLAKMGINIVVDTRGSRRHERNVVTKLGMEYVPIPWHCPFPKDKTFARFLKLLRENPEKKVFVHCRLGNDRTGMMIASYRMAEQGWTAERAMKEMKDYGFSASHHLICPRLADYEEDFPKKFQSSPAFQSLRTGQHPIAPQP
ncbi:MAG: hypothetical protein NVS1B11_33700 [Terriglobales bacterium]